MLLRDKQRIEKIKEDCEGIQATVRRYGDSFAIFQTDQDYQHSTSFCILQIGELVNGLTEEFRKETRARMQWQQMKAMRNIVVHDYGHIDLEVVWSVITVNIPDLKLFCQEQLSSEEELEES